MYIGAIKLYRVKSENIIRTDLCTMCSSDPKFYSYRKERKYRETIFLYIFKLIIGGVL